MQTVKKEREKKIEEENTFAKQWKKKPQPLLLDFDLKRNPSLSR